MKQLVCPLVVVVAFAGIVSAQGRRHAADDRVRSTRAAVSGDVHVGFSTHDVEVIRAHYGPRYRNLPPGLQKKLARTGQLPPGWQQKLEPFPVELERRLGVLPTGYRRGVIDGHAVIYAAKTTAIIDVTALF